MNQRPTHMQTEAHTTHGYYLEFAKVVFIEKIKTYINQLPTAHRPPLTSPQNGAHLYYPLCAHHTALGAAVQVPVGSGFVEIYYPHGSDIIIRGVASGTWQIHLAKKGYYYFCSFS